MGLSLVTQLGRTGAVFRPRSNCAVGGSVPSQPQRRLEFLIGYPRWDLLGSIETESDLKGHVFDASRDSDLTRICLKWLTRAANHPMRPASCRFGSEVEAIVDAHQHDIQLHRLRRSRRPSTSAIIAGPAGRGLSSNQARGGEHCPVAVAGVVGGTLGACRLLGFGRIRMMIDPLAGPRPRVILASTVLDNRISHL